MINNFSCLHRIMIFQQRISVIAQNRESQNRVVVQDFFLKNSLYLSSTAAIKLIVETGRQDTNIMWHTYINP